MNIQIDKYFKDIINNSIEKIKLEQNVFAIIINYYNDIFFMKDGVDIAVIIPNQAIENYNYSIVENNKILNIKLIQINSFKSFLQKKINSFLNEGIMIYFSDESIYEHFKNYKQVIKNDLEKSIFYMLSEVINYIHKTKEWLSITDNLIYAQFYILKSLEIIAQIETCNYLGTSNKKSISHIKNFNPKLISKFYKNSKSKLNKKELYQLIDEVDIYLVNNLKFIISIIKECLGDEEKSIIQICKYYKIHSNDIVELFKYLYNKNIVEKSYDTAQEVVFIMSTYL